MHTCVDFELIPPQKKQKTIHIVDIGANNIFLTITDCPHNRLEMFPVREIIKTRKRKVGQ